MEMNWKQSALLIIDMQNDFAKPNGKAYIEGTAEVVEHIAGIAEFFRRKHLPVIHVIRLYLEDGSNAELCRKQSIMLGNPIVAPGSTGAGIIAELLPSNAGKYSDQSLLGGGMIPISPYDFVIYKPRWGAFYNTELDNWLQSRQVDSLLVTGCNFPNCPRTTLYEASERDYRLAIVPDTISQIYPQGIWELKRIGVNVYEQAVLKNELGSG